MAGFLASLIGCASVSTGKVAKPLTPGARSDTSPSGLVLRGEENRRLTNRYVLVIDFTFENRTAGWLRIEEAALDFGSREIDAALSYPAGTDLIA